MSRSISSSDDRESPIVYYDIELDDAGLNPYEFRIYGRIARRAGGGDHSCTESLTNMADGCQMSRSSLIRAIKGLLHRKMISRIRKDGDTSEYRLLDKKHWIPVSHRNGGSVSQERGGVSHRNGGSVCETPKEYKEENKVKREREPSPLVSFVEDKPSSQPFSPNDDFTNIPPQPQWSTAERFVLKACELWDELTNQEKPVVETNWKTKQSVQVAGRFITPRLSVENRVGGTPKLFREFWHDKLKRDVAPRPDYVVEQWEAYDRWLIDNHEPHRRLSNAA